MKIDYLSIFRKSVEKITALLKYDSNNEYFMKTNTHFWQYLAQFFLEWENFQTKI